MHHFQFQTLCQSLACPVSGDTVRGRVARGIGHVPAISQITENGMTAAALIVAAGRGTRVGATSPKQYLDLNGKTVLRRSVERMLSVSDIDHVRCVIHRDDADAYSDAMAGLEDARLMPPVVGGETRGLSVRAGLEALQAHAPDTVLIHDAARPFVPVSVVDAVLDALGDVAGACAALPVVDALWSSRNGMAGQPVSRDGLWRAQTPQGFRFADILAAHRADDGTAADDVAVARAAGLEVRFVEGSERNFKITTPADVARARREVGDG